MSDPAVRYRNNLLPFLVSYSRLVMYSFGFQQSLNQGKLEHGNIFFVACLESATSVIKIVTDVLAPSGYLRYAADGHFVFAAFASAFLLKLLRPQFSAMMDADQQARVLADVTRLIKTLASSEVAVDDLHTPKLYARFLDGLLLKRNQELGVEATKDQRTAPDLRNGPSHPLPYINTVIQEGHRLDRGLLSPKIQVEAPEEVDSELRQSTSFSSLPPVEHNQLPLQDPGLLRDNSYAYSTAASSTIDGLSHTATHFSNEDVLMQGDDNWIATMGAIDNPTFWSNVMVPGFAWPSPESGWQQPIPLDTTQQQPAPPSVPSYQQHQQQAQQQQFSLPFPTQSNSNFGNSR